MPSRWRKSEKTQPSSFEKDFTYSPLAYSSSSLSFWASSRLIQNSGGCQSLAEKRFSLSLFLGFGRSLAEEEEEEEVGSVNTGSYLAI